MGKRFAVSLFLVLTMGVLSQAATFTLVDLPASGTDAAIGIDTSKIYTHAFDFGTSGVVTINGVALEQGPTAALSAAYTGTSAQGYGYTITDTRAGVSVAIHAGNDASSQADGNSAEMLRDMIYHSASTIDNGVVIILSDLTPGVTYSTRLYYRSWSNDQSDARTITCQADGESNGVFPESIDIELDGGGAHYLDYTFTADDTDVELQFITNDDNNGIHVYGLTNEIGPSQTAATSPGPADGEADVLRDTVLSWNAGTFAATHDVYVGESFDEVDAATVSTASGLDVTSFDPGRLEFGKTYFWRVDEVNGAPDNTVFKGNVWSFAVEPFAYAIGNIVATSNGIFEPDNGPENTVNGSGLNEDDQHSMEAGDMWLGSPDGEMPLTIQYEFDRVYKLHQMLVWNYNVQFELMLGFGIKDVTVEYSTDGTDWTVLEDVALAQATASDTYAANTTVEFTGVAAQYVRLTVNSGYGMLGQFGLSEVRFLYVPAFAREPQPASGSAGLDPEVVLSWRAGREAADHLVYVDTDEQAVIDGTAAVATVSEPSYEATVDLNQTYYWKVDEVNDVEEPAVWGGDIWSFSVAESLVVEDFESYNDDGNVIYEAWLDGWVNGTGSTVGYLSAPFAETTLAHSGGQSMPLAFENTGGITASEAERTFDDAQNLSLHGIKSLSLQFCGDAGNTTGQLYVKVNGTKVLYDGSAEDLKIGTWMPWIIDLAGLNVQNVSTLAVGIEGAGASGILFIDDIRVYPYDGQMITPVVPDAEGLVAYYPLDGDGSDAAGNHDGTISGTPDFVAGFEGQAIDLASNAGVPQYVTVAYSEDFALNSFTVAAWINVKDLDESRSILGTRFNSDNTFDVKVDATRVHGDIGDGTAWINTSVDIDAAHGGAISIGDWHHIAYAIDAATGTADLYLDGVLATTIAFTGTPLLMDSDQELRIGNCSGVEYMNGMIDEVRIYNRALSAAEVAGLVGRPGPFYMPF